MMNVERAVRSDRIMKSLTGITVSEFVSLLPAYGEVLNVSDSEKKRLRAPGAGAKHTPGTTEEKLFFTLFYIKCYPTFDVAGFFFDADRSQPADG